MLAVDVDAVGEASEDQSMSRSEVAQNLGDRSKPGRRRVSVGTREESIPVEGSHGDDARALVVALSDGADGPDALLEREGPVDDRRDLARRREFSQCGEILLVLL